MRLAAVSEYAQEDGESKPNGMGQAACRCERPGLMMKQYGGKEALVANILNHRSFSIRPYGLRLSLPSPL